MFRAPGTINEVDVIAFWRAVELFGPQEVPKLREDRVQDVGDAVLPWEDDRGRKGLRSTQTLQHDIFVGVFSLDDAYAELSKALSYPDEGENGDPPPAGESALAAFTVADDGRVILGSQVLSSCAWAIGRAFVDGAGSPRWLQDFERAAGEFRDGFEKLMTAPDDADTEDVPYEDRVGPVLDLTLLEEIGQFVGESLVSDGVRCAVAIRDAVGVRVRTRVVGTVNRYRATERNFLNSFIAQDLDVVAQALGRQAFGPGLSRYLASAAKIAGDGDRTRIDVNGPDAIDFVRTKLQPNSTPLGRWPSSVTSPADLGQQLAVNTIVDESESSESEGLYAVNGPPGTGKTTLLRDLVAALVVQRAERLAELESPESGFTETPVTFQSRTRTSTVPRLIPDLTGFEMVLACATNAAAENVTTEIPLANAIAPEWQGRSGYFTGTAANVLNSKREEAEEDREAWGMLAACLGSLSRCKSFSTAFWFEEADGLLHVLKNRRSTPEDWPEAVSGFRAALARAREGCEERQQYAQLFDDRKGALQVADSHATESKQALERVDEVRGEHDRQQGAVSTSQRAHEASLAARKTHDSERPSWWQTLLSFGRSLREWRGRDLALAAQVTEAEQALAKAQERVAQLAAASAEAMEQATAHQAGEAEERARAERLGEEIKSVGELWRERFPDAVFPDDNWAMDSERARRELRAPWADEAWNGARTELFLAALSLHEAFILGAANKMKQSLSVAMDVIQESSRVQVPAAAVLAAWQCLFMVVPVVSTTFASYPRLFRRLGREALGWVLIDEAGQSTPQNAAGPIWRSSSAVVVGDPLQLEPIVTLPLGTQRALARSHGVAEALLPGYTSLQRVADHATVVGAYRGDGDVWVGSPLNVHRRCEEPMFGIVNEIAYNGQMIDHTPPRGPFPFPASAWLHVASERSNGHWIAEEGETLTRLLEELSMIAGGHAESDTQAFLIAPFRDVANRLRAYRAKRLDITAGTIHTAQGREADIVVIVLGGDPRRTGDKRWAAEKPNLLNVAVSRARRRLYVIGNHDVWSSHKYFRTLAQHLPAQNRQ
ncbi:MAG TPA: ATP-binding protein [Solirubrobacteraceae bacterium]|jgi:hypothetical protein|nr:ATP-binding protein [Solirubrobacteraceae bacterium]